MGVGHSWGASIGFGEQSAALTAVSPTIWIPRKAESLAGKIPRKEAGSTYGKRIIRRQLPGVKEVAGNFTMDCLPSVLGWLLKWWNGRVTSAQVAASTVYVHTFTPADPVAGTSPITLLTLHKEQDNDAGEDFVGLGLDKLSFKGSNGSDPVEVQADFIGLDFAKDAVADSPVLTVETPLMTWQGQVAIASNSSRDIKVESWQIDLANGLARIPGALGAQTGRNVYPDSARKITGSLTLGFENHDQFDRLLAGAAFAINIVVGGNGTVDFTTPANMVDDTNPLALVFQIPAAFYTDAGGRQNTDKRMTEALPFVVQGNSGGTYDVQVLLYNTTANYSQDATAPTVSSTSPTDGGTNVAVNSNVVWTFSEQLMTSTIVAANFFLMTAAGAPVAGSLSYSSSAPWTVTFDPTSNLANATDYIGVATTGVRDVAGNALAANSVTNFTTVA